MSMKAKFQLLMVTHVVIVACLILALNRVATLLCLAGIAACVSASIWIQHRILEAAVLSEEQKALALKTLFDAPIVILLLNIAAVVSAALGAGGFIQIVNGNFAAGMMTVFAAILAVFYC